MREKQLRLKFDKSFINCYNNFRINHLSGENYAGENENNKYDVPSYQR